LEVLRFVQREGKIRGGLTWWLLVAGKGAAEDATNGAASRPIAAAAKEGKAERGERLRKKRRREWLVLRSWPRPSTSS
jgi:hypothetical protein